MNAEVQTERRPLPISYQSFANLRNEGCYYVDKTPLIREVIRRERFYFLSRPRRFGKSPLIDTLQELFEGNEPLFQGLDIHPELGLVGQASCSPPEFRWRCRHA